MGPQYNNPTPGIPTPGFGQRPTNYGSPGPMPPGGILLPIPSAAPVAAGAAYVSPAMPTRPHPYQTVPPVYAERGVSASGKRGLMRTFTTLFIVIVCLLVGGGIYFFFHQTGTSTPPESTIENPIDTTIDTTISSIENVLTPSITDTSATITWETDQPASSQVAVSDPNGVTATTEPQETLATSHSVTITGLKPNTTYHYILKSTDATGTPITKEGNLTTLATADKTAPKISGVNVSNVTESGAIVTWITDEPATSQVKYEKTEAVSSTTPLDNNLTTNHSVTLTKLGSGTTYNFTILSQDAAGNEATSASNQPFTTLTPIPVGPQVGNLAPPFTLKDLSGQQNVTLSDFRGKIVVVNFWATWCGACMEELPFFQAISDNESAGGFKILAINDKETKNQVLSGFSDKGYTFTSTILLDSTEEVKTLYDIDILPTTFFIDADGIIQERKEGSFQSQTEIQNILNSLQ
jgi:thiol-disulfide isomerase/thioredoxin